MTRVADLDGCGRAERITLDPVRAMTLEVSRNGVALDSAVPRKWKPWKLAICDADADGTPEIAVALKKGTRFYPSPHNCLFLYWFRAGRIEPRWLGSRLSRPYTDFLFVRPRSGKGDRLVALEQDRKGRSVALYRWRGFGFVLAWRSSVGRAATLVGGDRAAIIVLDRRERIRIPRRD